MSNSNFQNSPVSVLLFSKQSKCLIAFQSLISQNCILVLFFRFSPQMPRKQESPHVTSSLAQRHMWQPIKGHHCTSQNQNHIHAPSHKQNQTFSLHSVRSKSQQTQKIEEHEAQTLVFQNSIQAKIHGIHGSSQRFEDESSSLSLFSCNSSIEFVAESNKSNTITEKRNLRRKGKEIQRFRTGEEEEEESPVYFWISSKNQQKQNRIKAFWRFKIKSPNKTRWKSKNLPLSYSKTSTSPNQRRSVGVQKVRFKKNETLNVFFQNPKGF